MSSYLPDCNLSGRASKCKIKYSPAVRFCTLELNNSRLHHPRFFISRLIEKFETRLSSIVGLYYSPDEILRIELDASFIKNFEQSEDTRVLLI